MQRYEFEDRVIVDLVHEEMTATVYRDDGQDVISVIPDGDTDTFFVMRQWTRPENILTEAQ
jgi:hypothetical protein